MPDGRGNHPRPGFGARPRTPVPDITLELVTNTEGVPSARDLFREYQAEIGVDLSFQDFAAELDSLPGKYLPPRGRLYVVSVQGKTAGCAGLRPFDSTTCEMKRLFVRGEHRGLGLGRLLAGKLIADARSIGYERMVLDTLPSMGRAQLLYRSLGFTDITPYRHNPVPGAKYMELQLKDSPGAVVMPDVPLH